MPCEIEGNVLRYKELLDLLGITELSALLL